jgi:hypothetical protein
MSEEEVKTGAYTAGYTITKEAKDNYETEYKREDYESEMEAALDSPSTTFDSMFTMAEAFKEFVYDYTDGEEEVS